VRNSVENGGVARPHAINRPFLAAAQHDPDDDLPMTPDDDANAPPTEANSPPAPRHAPLSNIRIPSDWLAWRQTQPNQASSGFGAAVIASSSGQAGAEGSDTANRAASASGAQAADAAGASSASAGASVEAAKPRGGRLTLSNREVRDLANLPGEIETLEAEIAADQARMNEPDFFRQPPEQIKDFQTALADKEQKVLDMMTRWEELLEKEAQVNASRGR